MKAYLKNYRQSPRKVRTVANLIKGKNVEQALSELNVIAKRSASPLAKLLKSAIANAAHNFKQGKDNLKVKNIQVDKGIVLKRHVPTWRGMAHRIHKKTSNVSIELDVMDEPRVKKSKKTKLKANS